MIWKVWSSLESRIIYGGGELASWSTRSWTALQGQRLSIAIQFAVAYEIINEIGRLR